MLLNNAKKMFLAYATETEIAYNNLSGQTGSYNKFFPSVVNAIRSFCGSSLEYGSSNQGKTWLDVGFGDTAVDPDDYCLADSNYSNAKLTCVGYGHNRGTVGDILNIYSNFANNGNESVTVKEVGIVGNPISSNGANYLVLYYRKVLDTPLVIAPGEQYSFQLRVRIVNQ